MLGFIITIFAVIYLILAIYRLDLALMLLIFSLPTYLIRWSFISIPMTLLELMILIAFAVWVYKNFRPVNFNLRRYVREKKQHLIYPFRWEIILFLVISYLAVVVAGFSQSSLGIWKAYFFEPVLFFILIINVFKDRQGLSKIFWALAASAFVVSIAAIYQKITGNYIPNEFWAQAATRRVTSFFSYPNAVGLYLGPIVLLLTSFLFKHLGRGWTKDNLVKASLILVVIILSLLSIYFAHSEGALIGILAGGMIYGFFVNRRCQWLTVITLVLGVVIVLTSPPLFKYVKDKAMLFDLSGQIRRQQWIETKKMLQADGRWFWGTGLANYQTAIAPYHQEGIFVKNDDPDWLRKVRFNKEYRDQAWQPTEIYLYPHNIFLNFWSEIGLLGMLLVVWILIKYFIFGFKIFKFQKKNNNHNRYLTLGLISSMVVVVVHGFVDVPYFKNDLAALFWLELALIGLFYLYYKYHLKPQA